MALDSGIHAGMTILEGVMMKSDKVELVLTINRLPKFYLIMHKLQLI